MVCQDSVLSSVREDVEFSLVLLLGRPRAALRAPTVKCDLQPSPGHMSQGVTFHPHALRLLLWNMRRSVLIDVLHSVGISTNILALNST